MNQPIEKAPHTLVAAALCVFALLMASRVIARDFVWNSEVAEGEWNNSSNWSCVGDSAAYPSDASQDTATFNSSAIVTLASPAVASNVTFNAAVTLQSTPEERYLLTAANVTGSGAVTLSNSGFASPSNNIHTTSVAIIMTPGTTNIFRGVGTEMGKGNLAIKSNISGTGCYFVELSKAQDSKAVISGNNNAFVGDMYTKGGSYNNVVYWDNVNSGGSNTFVHIDHNYSTSEPMSATSIMFGGYDGPWYSKSSAAGITVGFLNRNSKVTIKKPSGSGKYNASVTKVGSAGLVLGSTNIYNLAIKEGTVTAKPGTSTKPGTGFNTLKIADGAKLLFAADTSWSEGNEYQLFTYSTYNDVNIVAREVGVSELGKGLAAVICKTGSTEIKVRLFAKAFANTAADAVVVRDADNKYTIEIGGETAVLNVPEGLTVDKVTVSPVTRVVTGLPENAKLRLAVSWKDPDTQTTKHAEYDIVQVDAATGAVTLKANATVQVEGESIPVRPELGSVDGVARAFEVRSDGVGFGVRSIPGLTYRLERAEEVGGLGGSGAAVVDWGVATGPRIALGDGELPGNVAFYRISVSAR